MWNENDWLRPNIIKARRRSKQKRNSTNNDELQKNWITTQQNCVFDGSRIESTCMRKMIFLKRSGETEWDGGF